MMLLSLLRNSTTLTHIHQIHAQIITQTLPYHNHLLSKLVDLRHPEYALSIFTHMSSPTDFSYNAIIKSHTLNNTPQKSLHFYIKMLQDDVKPSNFTYPFLLKACSTRFVVNEGEQVHAHVVKFGFEVDVYVSNSLIDMYSKCENMRDAGEVFDKMLMKDEVSWNSLISGYVNVGDLGRARELFEEMPVERNVVCWTSLINGYGRKGELMKMFELFLGMVLSDDEVEINSATMVCLLSACSSVSEVKLGKWVAVFIDVNGIHVNAILSTALIDMYSRCGELARARNIFRRKSYRNLVSWNAMITGYVQAGFLEEAIQLFYAMREKLVKPNEITMVNVLSACAGLGALELGREVHLYIGRNGLDVNIIVATALVDMYAKCGAVDDACVVFVKTGNKDVALWNTMILGLAHHGNGKDALTVLGQMEKSEVKPNGITYIGALSACNHSGLVEEGRLHFSNMSTKHGLSPTVEHYACMVDLLGRAGCLDEAIEMVQNMKVSPDSIIWGALLSACRIHQNADLADKIGEKISLSPDPNLGFCILLANIYASAGRWKDVSRVRMLVKEKGMKKPSGYSWIEIDSVVHRFLVKDKTHKECEQIYKAHELLTSQLKLEGYVPNFNFILTNTDVA